jgi:dienelactone hydrolase
MALAEEGFVARSEMRPQTMSMAGHLDDVLGGLDALRGHSKVDDGRIGIMGFSRGGLLTLQASQSRPQDVHAVVIMAPAPGNGQLEQSLTDVSMIEAPVRLYVAENDNLDADHVDLCQQVLAALTAEEKDAELTIYPAFGSDGHELFFEVREPYWSDVLAFLQSTLNP